MDVDAPPMSVVRRRWRSCAADEGRCAADGGRAPPMTANAPLMAVDAPPPMAVVAPPMAGEARGAMCYADIAEQPAQALKEKCGE